MYLRSILSIGLIAVAAAHPAFAQQGKTRDQVRAELAEAIRTGNITAGGEIGLPLNQLRPDLYPRVAVAEGKSREQVKEELAEALRTGDIVSGGESSYKLNEIYPNLYPPVAKLPGKTREQAREELAEALRTGDIQGGGELALKLNEQFPASYGEHERAFAGRGSSTTVQRGVLFRAF